MNVGADAPDVWSITRTWLIIGDGLHQGGWLPYDDVGEWGPRVTMLDRRHYCERDGAAIWGQPTLIWTDGQHCPIKWIMLPENSTAMVFYILWEFSSFSENWLWSRKRPWPAIITPWNQKLFLREIWEQLFFFSVNCFRHSRSETILFDKTEK